MLRAQHRIMLIGWDLDARMTFERGEKTLPGPNQLGAFLYWMLWKRPIVEVYLLKSNLRLLPAFDGIWFGLTPVSFVNQFTSKRMHFAIDGARPMGAVHHQEIAVVDDSVAFCGGLDLTVDRWDTSAHDHESRGRRTVGLSYGPRHEVAAAVDGEAALGLLNEQGSDGRQRRASRWRRSRPGTSRGPASWNRLCATSMSQSRAPCPSWTVAMKSGRWRRSTLRPSRRHGTPSIWKTNIWPPDASSMRWPLG